MSAYLLLLSTDHCALCDEAMSMLMSMPELAGMELRVVDVAADDVLLEQFGERVPVLQLWQAEREEFQLAWPFEEEQIWSAIKALISGSRGP